MWLFYFATTTSIHLYDLSCWFKTEQETKIVSFQSIPFDTNILPAFHCLTGCDSVSSFADIGKKKAFQVLYNKKKEKSEDLLIFGDSPDTDERNPGFNTALTLWHPQGMGDPSNEMHVLSGATLLVLRNHWFWQSLINILILILQGTKKNLHCRYHNLYYFPVLFYKSFCHVTMTSLFKHGECSLKIRKLFHYA